MAAYFDTSIDYIVGNTTIRRRIEPTREERLNASEQRLVAGYRALRANERALVDLTVQTLLDRSK